MSAEASVERSAPDAREVESDGSTGTDWSDESLSSSDDTASTARGSICFESRALSRRLRSERSSSFCVQRTTRFLLLSSIVSKAGQNGLGQGQ